MNKIIAVLFWMCLITKIHRLKASDNNILCACVYITWIDYNCTLSNSNSSQTLDEINFQSLCGLSDIKNAHNLELINFTYTDFPGVLLDKFNGLTTLIIENAEIKAIGSGEKFEGGSWSLKTLDLSHNEIKELPKNQFEQLHYINKIDLSHNMIEAIGDYVFAINNGNENTIDLSFNRLKVFKHEWFLKVWEGGLMKANFAFNEISEMNCTENVDRILHLNMSHNQILKSENFYGCMTKMIILELLDLSYNNLGTEPYLKLETFAELSSLKVLSLAGNKFSFIPYGLFSFQKNLEILDLSQNQFEAFKPNFFVSLINLKSLDMSFNKLRSVYEFIKISKFNPNLLFLGIEGNDFSCDCLSHLMMKFNVQNNEYRRNNLKFIEIMSPKIPIKKFSNIAGLICRDKNRYADDFCRQD